MRTLLYGTWHENWMIAAPLCGILKIRLRKDYYVRNKNDGVGFISNVRRKKKH